MARIRILVAVAAVALTTAASAVPAQADSPQQAMLNKVNSFRRAHGLRPVNTAPELMGSASAFAHSLMSNGVFGHASKIHASGRFRRLGEILAIESGLKPNVGFAFRMWLHSPGHRRIIMDPSFDYAGAGLVAGRFHGHKSTIWVMHFGRP
jgi:uncharacterized protein YkwD